jgi:hypothetical protein
MTNLSYQDNQVNQRLFNFSNPDSYQMSWYNENKSFPNFEIEAFDMLSKIVNGSVDRPGMALATITNLKKKGNLVNFDQGVDAFPFLKKIHSTRGSPFSVADSIHSPPRLVVPVPRPLPAFVAAKKVDTDESTVQATKRPRKADGFDKVCSPDDYGNGDGACVIAGGKRNKRTKRTKRKTNLKKKHITAHSRRKRKKSNKHR